MSDTNNETATEGGNETDLAAEVAKLRAKNKELLAEKQKAKQKAQEAQDAADEAEAKAAENSGSVEQLKAAHAKELQKLQAKLEAADSDLRTIRVDNEITKAISEGNVRSELSEAVTALLKSKVQYEGGIASIDGKPISDFASEYLGSDVGAHFRRASDNSGGGATGNTSTKASTHAGKDFNLGEYTTLKKTDAVAAAAWATETGNGYLNNVA
jgi:seryl-tRNA synthetase